MKQRSSVETALARRGLESSTTTRLRRGGALACAAAVVALGILSGASPAVAAPTKAAGAQPVAPLSKPCPKGWVPRPTQLNPALGPCVLGQGTARPLPGYPGVPGK